MKRRITVIFIAIFILCISLPYLLAHRDREGRSSSMENRMLAAYPSVWAEGGPGPAYLSRFEAWLDDNLRGRTVLVEANSTLQYQLFGRVVKSDILQGRNHWLFVKDQDMIREYQRLNLLPEDRLELYAEKMQKISDYLERRGIAFYYFQCYSKEEIYPEQYAAGVNRVGSAGRADQVVETLQEKTDVKQILTKDMLLERADELIYFQYVDSLHWNEKGSYYGYQTLMEEIGKDFGQIRSLQETDYLITEEESSVELYGFEYPYSELCPVYKVRDPQAKEITEQTQERWEFLHYREHTHDYVNEGCENDLRILLVGDSFVRMFLKDDIAEGFRETLSIDWLNIPILDQVVEEYQPDIVVLESAQSALKDTVELVIQTEFADAQ